jgi:hypothetical protein
MRMKKRDANDLIKLHETLNNPALEKRYQEVFSFVKVITDKGLNPHDLTAEDIEHWNKKFDDVLGQLIFKNSLEDKT